MQITALTASLLGLLLIGLTYNIVRLRHAGRISLGDGDDKDLRRAIRMHGNLVELAPINLILLACFEYQKGPAALALSFAALLVVGRVLHPLGLRGKYSFGPLRTIGMVLTLTSILGLAIGNLWLVVNSF